MQLEQVVVKVVEVQGAPLPLNSRAGWLHLDTCRDQAALVAFERILVDGERDMAIRTSERLALHDRQPNTTEQEELLTGQGELTIYAVIDLRRTERLSKQLRCALDVAHDKSEMADSSDCHEQSVGGVDRRLA